MEYHALFWAGAALAVLLALLGAWQRSIQRAASRVRAAEILEARTRGTNRPLMQHPQIDPYRCLGCQSCVRACPEEGVLALVGGVATLVHGARCIGHGRCAEACPVGAVTVGLGDISSRPDIPIVSPELETSVPGVYIAGELGGMALIRNAIEQGTRAVDHIAERLGAGKRSGKMGDAVDVLIVGAGPAGLAATLKAVERGLSYVTVDQEDVGGTVSKYPRRKLTMTQPVSLPLHGRMRKHEYVKEELIALWEGIIREHGLRISTRVRFSGAERQGGVLISTTSRGTVRSRALVLALGRRGTPRKLGVPGEDAEKVLYRLIDATSYRGERLLVVGGGDSAVEAAMALADQPGNVVTLSYRKTGFFRLKPRNEERIQRYIAEDRVRPLFSSAVQEITRDAVTLAVQGENGEGILEVKNDFVFVFAGGEPPFPLLKQIGVRFAGEGGGSESPQERAVGAR